MLSPFDLDRINAVGSDPGERSFPSGPRSVQLNKRRSAAPSSGSGS